MKSLLVAIIGMISVLYLINPGAGIVEVIPDNFPLIGNLDEAAATVLLINCLADLRHLFHRKQPEDADAQSKIITGKFSGP